MVQITDAGRKMLEQGLPLYDEVVRQTFGSLSTGELEALEKAISRLDHIVNGLEQKAGIRRTRAGGSARGGGQS